MIPTPFEAWAWARVMSDQPLNGELAAMSEPWRSMVERLATTPLEGRHSAMDRLLLGHPDRDAIIEAIADQDGMGPAPPIGNAPSGNDWPAIRLGSLPPAEAFPLDVLPIPARDLAKAASESIGCPIDFPALASLAAASGIIGRSVSLLIKPGYFASASLYVGLVGSPSSGKSPALRAALAPVWSISQTLYDKWRPEMDTWKAAKPDEGGPEPILERIISSDPTTEALGPILAKNPRGLIVAPDEMTKWVLSMDQYKGGRGGDRPFYLSAWNGEPIYIDRAKHMTEPIVVPHPFLTVVGGLTPDMLSTLPERRGRDDGFMARLLFSFPDRRPVRRYSEQGIPDDVAAGWELVALTLRQREMRLVDGKPAPLVAKMTPEAARAWAEWCQAHYTEQESDDFRDSLEGPWGKLEAYAARLALVLYVFDLASDPTRPAADLPDLAKPINEAAFRLVGYFKAHALRVYAAVGGKHDDGGEDVRALIRWIVRNDLAVFSERDIARNFDRFKDDPATLTDALGWMTDRNVIRPRQESNPTAKPGRKPSPAFDVNPCLSTSPRFRHFRRNST